MSGEDVSFTWCVEPGSGGGARPPAKKQKRQQQPKAGSAQPVKKQKQKKEKQNVTQNAVDDAGEKAAAVAVVASPTKKKAFWAEKYGVFIKGLPFTSTVSEIANMLGDCGELKGNIKQVLDEGGRWTGSVVVMFKEKASVDLALALNKTIWSGSGGDGVRFVTIVRHENTKSRKVKSENMSLFVGGLDAKVTEDEVREIFAAHAEHCGNVVKVRLTDGRGFGHVEFDSQEGRDEALKLKLKLADGVYVRLPSDPTKAKPKKEKKGKDKGKRRGNGNSKEGGGTHKSKNDSSKGSPASTVAKQRPHKSASGRSEVS